MTKRKDEETVKNLLKEASKNPIEEFYKTEVLARRGYDQYCLNFLEENESILEQIKSIKSKPRTNSYKTHTKDDAKQTLDKYKLRPRRGEEHLVLNMFVKRINCSDVFGTILDYQVPLKDKEEDTFGKIDFISEKDGELWFVEIKADYNKESILKAIFEIETYSKIVCKKKLLEDFGKDKTMPIKKVVAIFENSLAAKQCEDKKIRELAKNFKIKIVILRLTHKLIQVNTI